jgi:hypothetical protein
MFIILEWNGILPRGYIGEALDETGELIVFDTEEEAEIWAKENCAFNYKIVEL